MKSFEGDLSACNESEMEELACGGSRGWRVEASLAAATLIGNLFGHKMSKVGNMRKKNFRRLWPFPGILTALPIHPPTSPISAEDT